MTVRLSEALRRLAADVPPARVPDGLFDAARTRHRRRRAVVAGALAVLVLLLGTGYALHPVALPLPAGPRHETPGLPTRLVDPPLRTASVGYSAPGVAAMLFGGPAVRTNWFETRMGVVAADDDRYRVLDGDPAVAGFEASLSPDGRYVWVGDSLLDLTSGKTTPNRPDGYPLAFAPNGKRLVYADDDTTFTSPNTYSTPYVGVYDRDRGTDVLRVRVGTTWIPPGRTAALSSDGGDLALQIRDEVWLTRVGDAGADRVAEPYRKLPLAGGRLAGAGSWLPDGRSVAVLGRSTCTDCPVPSYRRTWTLALRSTVDGAPLAGAAFPPLRSRSFVQLLGWRSADEAVALVGVPGPAAVDLPENHDIAWGPYHEVGTEAVELVALRRGATAPEVLFRTPEGITDLSVAADLAISGAVRESGRAHYGPPPFWALVVGFVLAVLVARPVLSLLRRWRGLRGPGPRPRGPR
ncbi:hypothetical protein [Micromonospora sp. NPDC023888]|uniref:hypothetical protein n=1 Tax=Micromonospora sp. NPDC023888 TaxID=3155607 RepID=UPI00340D36C4